MSDGVGPAVHALPDGEAELSLVVRLPWEDVARLGQEAGRLAARLQRPVTLDEAAGHRLRSTPLGAHAKPAGAQPPAVAAGSSGTPSVPAASVSALPTRPPTEPAARPMDRMGGTA
ncbi:hypothetical protein [Streptomyces sp. PD-S100-1]|uniref:hypothetical protein n=1 Tax=unclassified Streptomyces TaxID=2593676 RepID=UPI0039BCFA82